MPQEYQDGMGQTAGFADRPAKVHLAIVQSVDPQGHTCDVTTMFTHKALVDVPFMSAYCHQDHGGGLYWLPEVNSHCYVCEPADGTYFIMGWAMNAQPAVTTEAVADIDGAATVIEEATDIGPNFKGNKEILEPGDIYMGTLDGNHVIVRRGGMVQIGATGLAQRVYLPIENLVRDYFQRYQAYSPVGEIEWGHAQLVAGETPTSVPGYLSADYANEAGLTAALTTAVETPVIVKYNIKDLCQEDVKTGNYTVEFRIGRLTDAVLDPEEDKEHIFGHENHKATADRVANPVRVGGAHKGIGSEQKGILSFTIYNHDPEGDGTNANKVNYAFQLNREGDALVFTNGNVHVEIDQTAYVRANEGVKIVYGGDKGSQDDKEGKQSIIELLDTNEFEAQVKSVLFKVLEEMDFQVETDVRVQAKGNIQLGTDTDELQGVVRWKDLKTWLESTFSCATPAGPSGPVLSPALASFEDAVASKTVKAKK